MNTSNWEIFLIFVVMKMNKLDCDKNSQYDSTLDRLADCDNSQENVLNGDVDIQINNSTTANILWLWVLQVLQLWVLHHCPVMQIVAVSLFQYRIICFILYSHMRSV